MKHTVIRECLTLNVRARALKRFCNVPGIYDLYWLSIALKLALENSDSSTGVTPFDRRQQLKRLAPRYVWRRVVDCAAVDTST